MSGGERDVAGERAITRPVGEPPLHPADARVLQCAPMRRLPIAALAAALCGAAGCQTFIGIEDPEGHLPRLDGDYLVGLKRLRADGSTEDIIRLAGTARLDPDTRELRIQMNQLAEPGGAVVAENAITGVIFDVDATEATFEMSIAIDDRAITAPSSDPADDRVAATMVMRAEGDYAFCAVPSDTTASLPSIGSILIAPGTPAPPRDEFDTACDDL